MKTKLSHTLTLMFAMIIAASTLALAMTVPQSMNFQGRLADSGGNPLTGLYSLTFTIYDDSISTSPGNINWQEVHPSVNVSKGLFSVVLGQGNPSIPLTENVLSGTPRFLEAKVTGDATASRRVRIVSVAYSLLTQFADTANIAMNLKLPMSDTVEYSGTAFVVANTGTGGAAMFRKQSCQHFAGGAGDI